MSNSFACRCCSLARLRREQQAPLSSNVCFWPKDNHDAIVEVGAPLGKNKRVTAEGAASVRNEVTGYTVVWADSQDDAAEMFEEHPHFQIPGAYIDVLPVMSIPGM